MAVQESIGRCAICGSAFFRGTRLNRIYCSRYCYKRAWYLKRRGPVPERCCTVCSARIPRLTRQGTRKGARGDRRFCSRRCAKSADYRRHRVAISIRGKARKAAKRKPRIATCKGCTAPFQAKRVDSTFCTISCFWTWFRKTPKRRVDVRTTGRKREAIQRGASRAERVESAVVFERDGWRCQLCGAPTPASLRGTRSPLRPTIDHIVPLSRGGAHTYQNVQCACSRCNGQKAVRTKGQFRLF